MCLIILIFACIYHSSYLASLAPWIHHVSHPTKHNFLLNWIVKIIYYVSNFFTNQGDILVLDINNSFLGSNWFRFLPSHVS